MKNIWILLAAVVMFAACDDNLEGAQQGAQGGVEQGAPDSYPVIVNVSATSALNYHWQTGDSVKVVFNADTAKVFAVVPGTDAALASFSYDVEEVKDVVLNDYVYVVAPGAVETVFAVDIDSNDAENKLKITCDIPDIQDGVITAEENLSYAVVSSELLKGDATVPVQLNSPFAVLDLTLPEGVKSVTFTADMYGQALVGRADVFVGTEAVVRTPSSKRVVTVADEDEDGLPVDAKVLVLPGKATGLKVKMEGVDGAMYEFPEKFLDGTELVSGETYEIDLSSDILSINFKVDEGQFEVLDEERCKKPVYVSPNMTTLTISMVSSLAGECYVDDDVTWINEDGQVKSFQSKNNVLIIAENTDATSREANVTISFGNDKELKFKVVQKAAIDMSIVNDAEGNQIVWEESFGLFNDSALSGEPQSSFTNQFTISLSDDFSKGAYMISNMFKADSYFDEKGQKQSKKGADYYADMEGDVLIVHKRAGGNSYSFSSDITLNYNRTDKTFTAAPIALSTDKYIGNYAVKVFVEQPAQEGSADIAGTWKQSVTWTASWTTPSTTMRIKVDGTSVTINDFISSGTEVIGTLDGNAITIPAGAMVESAGPLDAAVTLTISADAKSISAPAFSVGGWINVSAYSATKQ